MPGLISQSSSKKRKPDGEADSRPSKKAAHDGVANVHFSVLRNFGDSCPVIASSPGLSLPKNVPLKAYKKQTGDAPYELLLQSSAHARLDYEAHQDREGPDSHLQHYVGMYDPSTGDLKLLEARHLTMRSTLRPEESSEDEEDTQMTNAAKRRELTTAFGTKKAKKAAASISTNAIVQSKKGDAAEVALLDSVAAASGDVLTRGELQEIVDEAKPRPLANFDVADIRDVYPLETLIGVEDMLLVPIDEWNQEKPVQTYSLFVSTRLGRIRKSAAADPDALRRKLIATRYYYILIELLAAGKVTNGGGRRLPKRDDLQKKLLISGALLNSVMRRFGADGNLTKWNVDFLIAHVCALALFVDDFHSDTHDIRVDLRLKDKEMLQYFREIGAVITAPTEADLAKVKQPDGKPPLGKDAAPHHRIAKLRLPLVFPKQRSIVRKKR